MVLLLVLLVVTVALGRGGYDPWAMLTLEVGAAGLFLWLVLGVLWGTRPETRANLIEQKRTWRRLPFLARHPSLSFLRWFGLKGGSGPDIEILPPGTASHEGRRLDSERHLILMGFPFKRTGIGLPVVALTIWMGFSVLPLERGFLNFLSPQAHALRAETESLVDPDAEPAAAPWSLAPFLTLRGMWLWFAYLALFVVTVHLAEDSRKVERLTTLLLVTGVAFGIFGIGQWLAGLRELFGTDPSSAGLRATATFGNRNHYAAFVGMLLLCSLGWMGSHWVRITRGSPRASRRRPGAAGQEARAKLAIAGLGIVFLALGLVFSLSRSGISFALVACGAFALLVRPAYEPVRSETIELESSGRGRRRRGKRGRFGHWFWALALAVLAVAIWIGIDPVVDRFELLPEEWEAERGRYQVWADSLSAVEDFWLTGSGLSSFRYVYPIYRTFGGRIFYSWAHNDYLQALIELGVPGFACIVWILIGVSLSANRVRKNLDGDPSSLHLHAGYCAAAVAIALHSFTDFSLHLAADAALLSVVLGVVVGFGRGEVVAAKGSNGHLAGRESELS